MGVTTLTKAEIYEKYADQLIRFATGLVGPSDGRDVVSASVVNAMWSASWDSVVHGRLICTRRCSTKPGGITVATGGATSPSVKPMGEQRPMACPSSAPRSSRR